MAALLTVNNLNVVFSMRFGDLRAVNDVSFSLESGQRLGLVGESGAGKSVTGFSIINLISRPGRIASGSITFEGRELTTLSPEEMRKLRGDRISMIFQDPMMTLNPVLTLGAQMTETLLAHENITRRQAEERAVETLKKVYIPSPDRRLGQYPHELSGGMRQRIIIAIALLTNPSLIIADEPTTALDVTIQAEILDLLYELTVNERMGLILITHDLAVVSQVTERIAVMYGGRIVETGPTMAVIDNPSHPYTRGLIGALPESAGGQRRLNQIQGAMPSLYHMPSGCAFHPRCPLAMDVCAKETPKLCETGERGTLTACFKTAACEAASL